MAINDFFEEDNELKARERARWNARNSSFPGTAYEQSMNSDGYEMSAQSIANNRMMRDHFKPPWWASDEEKRKYEEESNEKEQIMKQIGVYFKKTGNKK